MQNTSTLTSARQQTLKAGASPCSRREGGGAGRKPQIPNILEMFTALRAIPANSWTSVYPNEKSDLPSFTGLTQRAFSQAQPGKTIRKISLSYNKEDEFQKK